MNQKLRIPNLPQILHRGPHLAHLYVADITLSFTGGLTILVGRRWPDVIVYVDGRPADTMALSSAQKASVIETARCIEAEMLAAGTDELAIRKDITLGRQRRRRRSAPLSGRPPKDGREARDQALLALVKRP